MNIQQTSHTRPDKDFPITAYTIRNSHGLTAAVMTYGAILTSLKVPDRNGREEEITLGFDDPFAYTGDHPFFGATVGRFANRIAHGRFYLDGKEYRLARNREGKHHLHGGVRGFDKVLWSAEPQENGVIFRYTSADGEEGYPGTLIVAAVYTLTEANELVIGFEAATDKPTPVNLTNHVYWNLAGHGSGDILDHRLKMHCSRFLAVDEDIIPTGEIAPVTGTPMDFTKETPIGQRIDQVPGGYDHCYIVDPSEESVKPVLSAWDPKSGRLMELSSTQPGVQLYTGNFLDGIRGRNGAAYHRHAAFCTETQGFPNAVNQPEFPSAILEPGQTYSHKSVFRFSAR